MPPELIGTIVIIFCILVILAFVLFIVYIVSIHQKNRNRHQLEIEQLKAAFQREILKAELEMQQQALGKISKEIHNNVGQVLSVSKLNLGMIDSDSAEVIEKIKYSVDLMSQAINDLRILSRRQDADMVRQEGLFRAVGEYIGQLRESVPADIIFTERGHDGLLVVEKELVIFRILQEAMNNVLLHAEASMITVDLISSGDSLKMTIRDNGRGFSYPGTGDEDARGLGIRNMQKRTQMMDGVFHLETEPGKGTCVVIDLPLREMTGA